MPLQPIRDMNEYKRIKESVRNIFDEKRSGDQTLFIKQSEKQLPLITAQKETLKSLEDKIVKGQEQNALVPLVREMKRRNDQIDMLAEQPFYHSQIGEQIGEQIGYQIGLPIARSSPAKQQILIDMDNKLDETDRENLEDLGFDLPSVVFTKNSYEYTFERIKSQNKSIGQFLGKGNAGKNSTESQKEIYKSKRNTLKSTQKA